MSFADWLIVIIPTLFIVGLGVYSRRYIRSVADFLSAGRVAGRYVMCAGDIANALSIIGLVSYIEMRYHTGFGLLFWNNLTLPVGVVISLFGFCAYRFRETRAMSLGQFLEMRYNRPFRVFASCLRSVSEMLANMIMPAIAARFFIYFLDLPHSISIGGIQISTFLVVCIICLSLAISIICCGGTLAMLITNAMQGIILCPLMVIFVVFILYKFDWSTQIMPVMVDRVPGESFLNPYDIGDLRDFNLLMVGVTIVSLVIHHASWIGAGATSAGKTPHEQKMAGILGTWRDALNNLFYVLIAIGIIVVMNHVGFSGLSKSIRAHLSDHIATELVSPANKADFMKRIQAVPANTHRIGVDEPLSQHKNLDTPTLTAAHRAFTEYEGSEAAGNEKFQQFRTLFNQQVLAASMHQILPPVITGLFCLLLVLAMVSTDDSRIYSASLTFTQDVILPLLKKAPSPTAHLWLIRAMSIVVGVFFLCGSVFMSQLDYISLFVTIMCMMWLGGCAPVMLFGLYSRFGNAIGAFASLISGMFLALGGILLQRNWAATVYPYLQSMGWVEGIDRFLRAVSAPFAPIIVWQMDAVKFPINAYELQLITTVITFLIFIAVSYATQKEPFNIDRMLHRGIYSNADDGEKKREAWSFKTVLSKLVGITPEYTKGDRIIAWSVFFYSFIYGFLLTFLLVIVWNAITPWTMEWWSGYFLVTILIIPGIIAFFSIFWFGIGGAIDIVRLFRDLKARVVNVLDNGMVEGNVSLVDKQHFEELESGKQEKNEEKKG